MLKKIKKMMGKEETLEQEEPVQAENQDAQTEEKTKEQQETAEENEVNPLEKENAELKAKIAELKDKNLRTMAEFENFRRRTAKERIEQSKMAAKDTLSALLPVVDDFVRAKKNADDDGSEEQFTEGVNFVFNKFQTFLKNNGVEMIESTGEPFDADIHEAVTEIPAPTEEMKGKIIDTIENGYKLNDKIIRFAKVVVGK